MVAESLQDLVDALSARLRRPVLIDDPELHPLAYSSQSGELDTVRTASILGRGAPPEVREALFAQGIATAHAGVHVAPDPSIDMAARFCVPLLSDGGRWGYLWIIEDRPLPAEEERAVAEAARRAAAILGEAAGHRAARRAGEQALLDALAAGRPERDGAPAGRPLTVCLVELSGDGGDEAAAWVRSGLTRFRRAAGAGAAVDGSIEGRAACLVAARPALLTRAGAETVAGAILGALAAEPALTDTVATVGQSHLFDDLAAVPTALRRARAALRAAPPGTAAAWDGLGADRLLAGLSLDALLADLPAGVARLLDPEHAGLRATLEAYLDRAGDVKGTAAALSLHRAGLYYRLKRIEELTGLDLRRGEDRLLGELALRAARLSR